MRPSAAKNSNKDIFSIDLNATTTADVASTAAFSAAAAAATTAAAANSATNVTNPMKAPHTCTCMSMKCALVC